MLMLTLFFTHYLLYYILVVAFRHYDSGLMPCHVYSHLLVTKCYIASILVADIFTPRVSLLLADNFNLIVFNISTDTLSSSNQHLDHRAPNDITPRPQGCVVILSLYTIYPHDHRHWFNLRGIFLAVAPLQSPLHPCN